MPRLEDLRLGYLISESYLALPPNYLGEYNSIEMTSLTRLSLWDITNPMMIRFILLFLVQPTKLKAVAIVACGVTEAGGMDLLAAFRERFTSFSLLDQCKSVYLDGSSHRLQLAAILMPNCVSNIFNKHAAPLNITLCLGADRGHLTPAFFLARLIESFPIFDSPAGRAICVDNLESLSLAHWSLILGKSQPHVLSVVQDGTDRMTPWSLLSFFGGFDEVDNPTWTVENAQPTLALKSIRTLYIGKWDMKSGWPFDAEVPVPDLSLGEALIRCLSLKKDRFGAPLKKLILSGCLAINEEFKTALEAVVTDVHW